MADCMDNLIREGEDKIQVGGQSKALDSLILYKDTYEMQKKILD